MFKVIDNFLDKTIFKEIQKGILENSYFPWYFSEYNDYFGEKGLDKSKYIHTFYENNNSNSKQYNLLLPIIEKLKCLSLIKIKINSTNYSNKIIEGTYHIDNEYKGTKTAVYYLNTNDGYTKFKKNKKKINSVENRMIVFDSNLEHLGTNTTNAKRRVVLNINYF
jgi:hypothetical protein|tara:strand:- start:169 stop:663 length:495 start_codon:yes stop_codon:yes gene_type:complete